MADLSGHISALSALGDAIDGTTRAASAPPVQEQLRHVSQEAAFVWRAFTQFRDYVEEVGDRIVDRPSPPPRMLPADQVYSVNEIASLMHCSGEAVRRHCRRGTWSTAVRIGNSWVVERDEIQAYLDQPDVVLRAAARARSTQ